MDRETEGKGDMMETSKFPGFSQPITSWYQFPISLDDYMCQLSGNEFKVLASIIKRYWSDFNEEIYKGNKHLISDELGMSKKTLKKCLDGLQEKGFIKMVDVNKRMTRLSLAITEKEEGNGK